MTIIFGIPNKESNWKITIQSIKRLTMNYKTSQIFSFPFFSKSLKIWSIYIFQSRKHCQSCSWYFFCNSYEKLNKQLSFCISINIYTFSNFCFLNSFFTFSICIITYIIRIHSFRIRWIDQNQYILSLTDRTTKSVRYFFC